MKVVYQLLVVLFIFTSCIKIGESYVGLNLQPDMSDSPFVPGLNVFGLVKTGPDFDTLNHYFEVQRMVDLLDWNQGIEVHTAQINLTRTTVAGEVFNFEPQHTGDALYFDETLEAMPGDRWEYSCVQDSFWVRASCTVPQYPLIVEGHRKNNELSFTIKADSTAYLYVVSIFNGENVWSDRKINTGNSDTPFHLKPEWEMTDKSVLIYVCAYDKNLREYLTTSNTFFKPNAFRPSFSTVEGGYGTFGAISIATIAL